MSLDVHLSRKYHITYDEGKTLEEKEEELYWGNITHNLGVMADEAGLYEALWRPYKLFDDYNIPEKDYDGEYEYAKKHQVIASDIIKVIEVGLQKMKDNPEHYKTFDSPNGWGLYINFIPFIEKYLAALKKYPESIVSISR